MNIIWPNVPLDAYEAFCHGGPRAMVVLPGYNLTILWIPAFAGMTWFGAFRQNSLFLRLAHKLQCYFVPCLNREIDSRASEFQICLAGRRD
jgi:hypothetical protein